MTAILGLLPTAEDLTPDVQQGLHYAPSVLVLDAEPGAALPATGRGNPVAAAGTSGLLAGPVAVLWGKDAALARQLAGAPRRTVLAVVASKASRRTVAALRRLQAAGVTVHLLHCPEHPVRVLQDGDTVRLEQHAGSWQPLAAALPEPATPAPE